MAFSAKDAGLFVLSGTPGTGATVTVANPAGGTSTLLLPMAAGDDGNTFDVAIYAVDSNGNPLTGSSALFEVQKNSTFAWNAGTNATFSRTAGNVVTGTAGAGTLVNFTGATGYRLAVGVWTSVKALSAMLGVGASVSGGTAGRVLFEATGPVLADSANLQFDGTNLGVGQAPQAKFWVHTATDHNFFARTVSANVQVGAATEGFGGYSELDIDGSVLYLNRYSAGRLIIGGSVDLGAQVNIHLTTDVNLGFRAIGSSGQFFVVDDPSNNYEHFRIDGSVLTLNGYSGGNVGIGYFQSSTLPTALLHVQNNDTSTSGVVTSFIIGRHSTNGVALSWQLDSSTTANQPASYDQATWGTATHASRAGSREAGVYYTTTAYPGWHIDAAATGANLALLTSTGSYGGGVGVVFLPNAVTNPSSNPTGGGVLYSDSGTLKWRDPSGTTTAIAPSSGGSNVGSKLYLARNYW